MIGSSTMWLAGRTSPRRPTSRVNPAMNNSNPVCKACGKSCDLEKVEEAVKVSVVVLENRLLIIAMDSVFRAGLHSLSLAAHDTLDVAPAILALSCKSRAHLARRHSQ